MNANIAEGLVYFPRRSPAPWPVVEEDPQGELVLFGEARNFWRHDLSPCHCGAHPRLEIDYHHDEATNALIYPVRKLARLTCGNPRCNNSTPWLTSAKLAVRVWELGHRLARP